MEIVFWKGILMGLLMALPTGAVSFIIIRRMYLFGMKSGMYSVVGSMISDLLYASIVGFGLQKIRFFLIMAAQYIEIVAGVILIYTGYKAWTESKFELSQEIKQRHPVRDLVSISFLNLMNPAIILSFTTIFLVLGMGPSIGHTKNIITFLIGLSTATIIFWYILGRLIVLLRNHNRPDMVSIITKASGAILFFIGVVLVMLALIKIIFPH
jgi:threonine/homoserine/homoserine lactone efflux protein